MSELISNIITTIIATSISAGVSYLVAKTKAENEIKKLTTTFKREDILKLKEDFSALMVDTERFCSFAAPINKQNAIKANTNFLSVAPERFKPLLLSLDKALKEESIPNIIDLRNKLLKLYSETV